jgi:hypothetical protein
MFGIAAILVVGAWTENRRDEAQAREDAVWRQFISDVSRSSGRTEDSERFWCELMRASLRGVTPSFVLTPGTTPVPLSDWDPPSDEIAQEYLDVLCSP